MNIEKPLHVQVAYVLGWTAFHDNGDLRLSHRWAGTPPESPTGRNIVPRFDTDWSATGPLIEKYGFWLRQLDQTLSGPQPWDAFRNDDLTFPRGFGPTPLIAVCRLILALAEAGVLKAEC